MRFHGHLGGRQRPSLHAINIEPAVAVKVDQAHSSRHCLGDQVLLGVAALELKAEAGRLGVVDEIEQRPFFDSAVVPMAPIGAVSSRPRRDRRLPAEGPRSAR